MLKTLYIATFDVGYTHILRVFYAADEAEKEQMKKDLVSLVDKAAEEEKGRPSLIAAEQGCPAPKKIEYTPGQPVETLCSLPVPRASAAKK